jgi:hypothetical protein
MSDRGSLFLFSLGVILASLAAAAWLIATGQVAYIGGLFLLICCLTLTMAFSLYVKYLIKNAMQAPAPPTVHAKSVANMQEKFALSTRAATKETAGKEVESTKVLG